MTDFLVPICCFNTKYQHFVFFCLSRFFSNQLNFSHNIVTINLRIYELWNDQHTFCMKFILLFHSHKTCNRQKVSYRVFIDCTESLLGTRWDKLFQNMDIIKSWIVFAVLVLETGRFYLTNWAQTVDNAADLEYPLLKKVC